MHPDLDSVLWGDAPSAEQLAWASQVGEKAVRQARGSVLADALTVDQTARRLRISCDEVVARVRAGQLVALAADDGDRVPAWQLTARGTLPGLEAVIAAWPGTSLSLSVWAMTPSPDLDGRCPADHLARRLSQRRVLELLSAHSAAV